MKDVKKPLLVRLPPEVKSHLGKAAQERGVSVNALISQVLWEFLKTDEKERMGVKA